LICPENGNPIAPTDDSSVNARVGEFTGWIYELALEVSGKDLKASHRDS